MALLEQDHAFEIADALIAASEGDGTEVSLHSVEEKFVRFCADGPTQSADRERYSVRIRVRQAVPLSLGGGYREASASAGDLHEASLFSALDRATALAAMASVDRDAEPLGGACDITPRSPSRPTQDHSTREKGAWIRAALDASDDAGLDGAGLAHSKVESLGLVNSSGRRVFSAASRASFQLSCVERCDEAEAVGGASSAMSAAPFTDQVDPEGVIADAVDAAVQSRGPEPIDPQAIDVVLAPAAVAALLTFASRAGFGAREYEEGSSFLSGRVGERLFDPRVSICDDVHDPRLRGLGFDGEGEPRVRTPLVEEGVVRGPVTDRRFARKLGLSNTGHGGPQPTCLGPCADALVIEPGERSIDDLCADVGDGLYVRQLHYVNLIEPRGLVLTGMTRGGTFRIEGGELGAPVRNLRFTHSLVAALEDVIGVGDTAIRQGSLMGGDMVVPAIALRGFRFTSA